MIATIIMAMSAVQATPGQSPESTADDIVVIGSREAFRLSTRALRAAQSEFAEQRSRFAPEATLLFLATKPNGMALSSPLRLNLTDGVRKIPIALNADGSFRLPQTPAGKWWLETNRDRRQLKIRPLILSPKASRYEHRLGDARLQCRVLWAMEKASISILAAPIVGMFEVAGPCSSRKIGIYTTAPAPIRTATLAEGARTIAIPVMRDRSSYRLPVSDKTFSNEAHIKIVTD